MTEQEYKYLKCNNPRTSIFYMLPKIHRKERPPPGCPIVSACDSPTEKLTQFVDYHLRDQVTSLPSNLRDISDLLEKLKSFKLSEKVIFPVLK